MAIERTFGIIKPDAVARGAIGVVGLSRAKRAMLDSSIIATYAIPADEMAIPSSRVPNVTRPLTVPAG